MNDETLEKMLKTSLTARPEHVVYGDLAQRATRLARQQAAMQLARLRRMNQMFGAIALILVAGVLVAGYRQYSVIASAWASTDAASTLSTNTITTTWVSYQGSATIAMIVVGAVIVGMAIVWQFVGDDRAAGYPMLG